MNAHLARAVSSRSRAQAQGFGSLAWNAGWATGGAVGGALLATLGGGAFAFGGALGLAGVAVGLWMLRPRAA
jgi:predicted MFS family arabinose efflux permease